MKKLLLSLWVGVFLLVATPAKGASQSMTYSLSPGIAFVGNLVGPSFNSYIGVNVLRGHEFYVGGDLGVDFVFPSAFAMGISMLPSTWYQFKLPDHPKIRLVFGLSFGPYITVGAIAGLGSGVGVTYQFGFRPGFLVQTSATTFIGGDLKIGVVGGAFFFKPTANFVFLI